MIPAREPKQHFLNNPGCGCFRLELWLGGPGCGILAVESWLWKPACRMLSMESWLWNPSCEFLVVESWLRNLGGGLPELSGGPLGALCVRLCRLGWPGVAMGCSGPETVQNHCKLNEKVRDHFACISEGQGVTIVRYLQQLGSGAYHGMGGTPTSEHLPGTLQ